MVESAAVVEVTPGDQVGEIVGIVAFEQQIVVAAPWDSLILLSVVFDGQDIALGGSAHLGDSLQHVVGSYMHHGPTS